MSWIKYCDLDSMEVEHLLEQKVRMSRDGLLDPVLRTNLDFAMGAVDALPAMMKKNALMRVEGQQLLLVVRAGAPQLLLTVFQDHEGPKLHQKILVKRPLNTNDLHKSYFVGHHCPLDVPCRQQALNVLLSSRNVELKVICKELRITFTSHQPESTVLVP